MSIHPSSCRSHHPVVSPSKMLDEESADQDQDQECSNKFQILVGREQKPGRCKSSHAAKVSSRLLRSSSQSKMVFLVMVFLLSCCRIPASLAEPGIPDLIHEHVHHRTCSHQPPKPDEVSLVITYLQ